MNRREQIEDSRKRIEEGFLVSARQTGYSSLTNTRIADAAGVSRMTFYRHFGNKRDVLLSLLERLSSDMHAGAAHTVSGFLSRRFELLQANRNLQLLLADPAAREVFRDFRWKQVSEFFPGYNDGEDQYRRAFVLAGLDALTMRWLETGMREPMDEMVALALQLVGTSRTE